MPTSFLLIFLLVLALGAAYFWVRVARPAIGRARQYIEKVSTCGYLAPPPTPGWVRFLQGFSAVVTGLQVGRITVIGQENLPPKNDTDSPFMVCPNHPHYVDPGVIVRVVDRPARYMAAQGVFTFGHGFGALLAGPCGAFAVDLTKGKGAPARLAAIKVLTSGQVLVMFPEGWAYLDGHMGPLHKGAVRIAKEAHHELGKPVKIVPVFLRYGRYPGQWIKRFSPPLQYYWVFMNKWYYRRGCTVVIGKPILSSELPEDDCAATEMLRQRITGLDPQK